MRRRASKVAAICGCRSDGRRASAPRPAHRVRSPTGSPGRVGTGRRPEPKTSHAEGTLAPSPRRNGTNLQCTGGLTGKRFDAARLLLLPSPPRPHNHRGLHVQILPRRAAASPKFASLSDGALSVAVATPRGRPCRPSPWHSPVSLLARRTSAKSTSSSWRPHAPPAERAPRSEYGLP